MSLQWCFATRTMKELKVEVKNVTAGKQSLWLESGERDSGSARRQSKNYV
jgi:hypothetical protein